MILSMSAAPYDITHDIRLLHVHWDPVRFQPRFLFGRPPARFDYIVLVLHRAVYAMSVDMEVGTLIVIYEDGPCA